MGAASVLLAFVNICRFSLLIQRLFDQHDLGQCRVYLRRLTVLAALAWTLLVLFEYAGWFGQIEVANLVLFLLLLNIVVLRWVSFDLALMQIDVTFVKNFCQFVLLNNGRITWRCVSRAAEILVFRSTIRQTKYAAALLTSTHRDQVVVVFEWVVIQIRCESR